MTEKHFIQSLPDKKNGKKPNPLSVKIDRSAQVGKRATGFPRECADESLDVQSFRLSDTRVQTAQRQAMAGYIGQIQGNRQLQRLLVRTESALLQRGPDEGSGGFRLRSPQLTVPGTEGPSLGVGKLELDMSPFSQLGLDTALSPSRLFQPSAELIQQLVDNWILCYRITHPGPPMAESEWQQLWSAWRRLTDKWLEKGAGSPTNPQLAQEIFRDQAAQEVLNLQKGSSKVSLLDIGSKTLPAFQKSLEATQFYPKIKQNAGDLLQLHWPILIPTLGTALGTSLGMGFLGNDWRAMEKMSALLPMLSKDFRLGENWTLSLSFAESTPVKGAKEKGVVLGVNPSVVFKYKSKDIQFSVGGSVNMRIETGQESGRNPQISANPAAKIGFEW